MKIPAVLDCTCLIGLERIGRLDFLLALLEPIIAPPAVVQAFRSGCDWIKAPVSEIEIETQAASG